jgi:hypothetical protein
MDWGLVGVILAIIFGLVSVISIVVAIRLARKKGPVWAYKTNEIIELGDETPDRLKLTYNNENINNAYRTRILFLNKGNQAIRSEDVRDKIAFKLGGAKILRDPIILTQSKPQINSKAFIRDQKNLEIVELDFDFLDYKDGVLFEILHTKYTKIEIFGYIIESNKIKCVGDDLVGVIPRNIKLMSFVQYISGVCVGAIIFSVWNNDHESANKNDGEFWLAFALVVIILVLVPILSWLYSRYGKYPRWVNKNKHFY